jgi:hypothetical protein
MRLHHYSIQTERSYVDWIKRYVEVHQKIEAFLSDLAVRGKVAAATQNQAFKRVGG